MPSDRLEVKICCIYLNCWNRKTMGSGCDNTNMLMIEWSFKLRQTQTCIADTHTCTHTQGFMHRHTIVLGPGAKLISPCGSHRKLPISHTVVIDYGPLNQKENSKPVCKCERQRESVRESVGVRQKRKIHKRQQEERERQRAREAVVSHQVRSKVCIFDAELGLSILERRRALETVTMTTRHSTTALTCRQRTTASTWPPANTRRAEPLGLKLTWRGWKF